MPGASGWPALDAAGRPPARTAAHGQDGWLGTDSLHGWSCSEDEFLQAYPHRWPVETNFFVAQDTTAMEMPRAWTAKALERRISLSLLTGALLQAIAAATAPLAMGPWDRKPMPSAGRLANYLDIHAAHFSALALQGVEPRNYRVMHEHTPINELPQPQAA